MEGVQNMINPETKLGEKTYGFCGIEYYDFKTKEFGKPVMSYRIQPDHRRIMLRN